MTIRIQYTIAALALLCSYTTADAQKAAMYKVVITCTQTSDYCGGAQPQDEMLEELRLPKPLPNATYYLVRGSKRSSKVYKKVTSNDLGEVQLNLPAGSYTLLSAEQIKAFVPRQNDKYTTWDNACLKQRYNKPLLVLRVRSAETVSVNVHNNCFYNPYCGQYSGPLPP
jgi:nitrite reductase/ring-hydroxylating ferredoxin subunit